MKRFPSIKKNIDFQRIYRQKKSYANRLFVMYVEETGEEENHIGISVSKKVGNSVVRHRMCRQIREIFRLNKHRIQTGLNIILVVRPLKVRTHCIYVPTCSQYAVEALTKYGAFKGMWLTCKRLLRCHPFAEGGYDPVP